MILSRNWNDSVIELQVFSIFVVALSQFISETQVLQLLPSSS